jgi:hypothetical protein
VGKDPGGAAGVFPPGLPETFFQLPFLPGNDDKPGDQKIGKGRYSRGRITGKEKGPPEKEGMGQIGGVTDIAKRASGDQLILRSGIEDSAADNMVPEPEGGNDLKKGSGEDSQGSENPYGQGEG